MASSSSSIAAIKRHRTGKLASLGTRAYYLHRRGQDDKMYSLICDEFIGLGGIYIKFLQGVLLQSQVFKRWHNPERLNIFENLDHEPIDVVSVLRHELTTTKLSQISLVQPQPFAAGSFGQVYYGQHVSGKPIVIKVLRPMVRELLKYDLRLLGMFTRRMVSKGASSNMDVSVEQAIKDFRRATLRETDYVAEANFAHELYEVYKDHPTFIVPETFLELCTSNIIVQEYVDGLSVAQLIRFKEQGVDPKPYILETLGSDLDIQLQTLGEELINGMFNLTRIQGDPHPGNVRLMSGNKVGMIDFGIAAPTPDNKAALFGIMMSWNQLYSNTLDIGNLFEQFMRFFVSDLYRALKRLASLNRKTGSGEPGVDANYTREMGRIAQKTFQETAGVTDIRPLMEDGRILQILNKMINKDNRFGLVLKLEASEILRASQTYITLVDALGRRNDVLPKVFASVVSRVGLEHPEMLHDEEASMDVSEALDIVSDWLERVANRDPALFSQLVGHIKLGSKLKSNAPKIKKEATEPIKEEVHA